MSNLFYLDECLSTNDEIETVLLQNNLSECGVYTFRQTKGKGQYGNSWETQAGLNIAYTIAVKVSDIKNPQILFNFHTANLLRAFLAKLTSRQVYVKWPNDIIIGGKKVCGMLTEKKKAGHDFFYMVGLGINVLQQNFDHLPKGGSLLTQTGITFNLHDLARTLHDYFSVQIKNEKPGDEIVDQYNHHLFRKGAVSVFEAEGIRQNGIIENCDEDGFLTVNLENSGRKRFFFKEIELLY